MKIHVHVYKKIFLVSLPTKLFIFNGMNKSASFVMVMHILKCFYRLAESKN